MIPLTREQQRSRRARAQRSQSVPLRELTQKVLDIGRRLFSEEELEQNDQARPQRRSECAGAVRPCPWIACSHHLYLDITDSGSIKLNYPDMEPEEMAHSCSLDVAAKGGAILEDVAAMMNLTRERVRQVELIALRKLKRNDMFVRELAPEGKRRLPMYSVGQRSWRANELERQSRQDSLPPEEGEDSPLEQPDTVSFFSSSTNEKTEATIALRVWRSYVGRGTNP